MNRIQSQKSRHILTKNMQYHNPIYYLKDATINAGKIFPEVHLKKN